MVITRGIGSLTFSLERIDKLLRLAKIQTASIDAQSTPDKAKEWTRKRSQGNGRQV
jgi:hypothetical protein